MKCGRHARCFKYRFLDLDADEPATWTSLLAWRMARHKVTRAEHVHPFFVTDEEDMAAARALAEVGPA